MLNNDRDRLIRATMNHRVDTVRPRFLVCLAAFNGIKWLSVQLDSILAQSGIDVVVMVSVDRSSDGTEALIDARARDEPRLVVLPHGHRFGGAARNFFSFVRFGFI